MEDVPQKSVKDKKGCLLLDESNKMDQSDKT